MNFKSQPTMLAPPNMRSDKINGFKNNKIKSQVYAGKEGSELNNKPTSRALSN